MFYGMKFYEVTYFVKKNSIQESVLLDENFVKRFKFYLELKNQNN